MSWLSNSKKWIAGMPRFEKLPSPTLQVSLPPLPLMSCRSLETCSNFLSKRDLVSLRTFSGEVLLFKWSKGPALKLMERLVQFTINIHHQVSVYESSHFGAKLRVVNFAVGFARPQSNSTANRSALRHKTDSAAVAPFDPVCRFSSIV